MKANVLLELSAGIGEVRRMDAPRENEIDSSFALGFWGERLFFQQNPR